MLCKFISTCENLPRSSAGQVFTSTSYGLVLKNNSIPCQPFSHGQERNKINFFSSQSFFRSLSSAEQNNWNLASPSYPKTDKCGNTYFLKALQLFSSQNIVRQVNGHVITTTPPTITTAPAPNNWAILGISVNQILYVTNPNYDANLYNFIFWAAPPQPSFSLGFPPETKIILRRNPETEPAPQLWQAYTNEFGPYAVGDYLYIGLQMFSPVSNLYSSIAWRNDRCY